jgi:hypothetical protein
MAEQQQERSPELAMLAALSLANKPAEAPLLQLWG